ncbi:hypothetical protein [Nitrososphaera viennensis]|uniref:Uncharacterized protein n=2 Tax=Nitrososphaera viennensis TaxID=1034015 RepID=A0A060HRW2_9ARCH|nr:hypothetical protein [Nitrososphaera viennensis]AIC16266.1 hypothetical protein NVIE_020100 [Nitrososphaera viennensis EN76]UVS68206.1 hypothetical protein NWT39_09875 [Nitrososphaera viennensis]
MKEYDFRTVPSTGTPSNTYWGVKSWQNNAPAPQYVFNDSTAWIGNAANLVVTTRNSNSGTQQQGWCAGIQGCDPWGVCATGGSTIIKTASNSNSMFTGLPVIPKVGGVEVSTINVECFAGWFSSSAPGASGPQYANILINFWYKHKTQPRALVIDFAIGYLVRSGSSWVQRTDVPVGGQYSGDHIIANNSGLTTYHYAYCLQRMNSSNTIYFLQTDVKPVVLAAFNSSLFNNPPSGIPAIGNRTDYDWVGVEVGAEIDTSTQAGTGTLKVAIQKCRVDW